MYERRHGAVGAVVDGTTGVRASANSGVSQGLWAAAMARSPRFESV
jgi:hypothetical protein